jgi:hypothetical protein
MYNMACGNNPLFWVLARLIETRGILQPVPRFRDMYTREVGGAPQIVIYTRTGGNNRGHYKAENDALARHVLFIETFDDHFDSTFASFAYSVPPAFEDRLLRFHRLFSKHPKGMSPPDKFQRALKELEGKAEPAIFTNDDCAELADIVKQIIADLPDKPSSIEIACKEHTTNTPLHGSE